ncbi:MAG: hypothetical protein N3I35_17340 [Clostridia bacterium]|nr:hypothetical protein [Clostridia bacterium]
MMQKPWFKLFIWFLATFFFYLASGVIISMLKPGPTENEVMKYMTGMMSAMDSSMMGVAMNIENDGVLSSVIALSSSMAVPIILVCVIAGFAIRSAQRGD